jgi:site-specific DNA recombinase
VVVEVYIDNDLSAYSGKPRTDCLRMRGDVISGRITAIGAWHSDRLHRPDLRELEDFIDLIEGNKTL